MPQGLISRGDLLRALIRHEGALSAQAVQALGYTQKPPEKQERPDDQKHAGGSGKQASEQVSETLFSQAPPAPVPFWQPVTLVPDEIERPDVTKGTAPARQPQRAAVSPPAYKYLASFKELAPRLRAALSAHRPSRSYDIPRIVSQIGRGEILQRMPRRHRTGWGSSLYVIEDRSNHLAPYVRDQAMVQFHLRQLYPSIGFHQAIYSECYAKPQVFWPDGRVSAIKPKSGDQVLVLGDLGCLARNSVQATAFWVGFGEELLDLGAAALALLPCAPAECPQSLANHYHLLSWEHPAPKVLNEAKREARGAQLLAQLSVISRIEPRLLREIRLALDARQFPARMEAWVWQHPVMADPDMIATALASEEALPRHKDFRQPENRLQGIASLRAAQATMVHLPYELWLETVINLADWDQAVISSQERQDGVALLNYLAGRLGRPVDAPLSARAKTWLEDFYHRLSDEVKAAPATKDACWVLAGVLTHKGEPNDPPQQPMRFHLYQQGDKMQLLPQLPEHNRPGSHLCDIRSRDGLIRLEPLHGPGPNDFWQAEPAPAWASGWGQDEYGIWVDFIYEGVRQRLRWIPPGRFQMGSLEDEPGRYEDESPQHQVVIHQGYWLFDTPVTQALWQAVMGDNPSRFNSPDRPVEQVSWDDCQAFLQKLNTEIQGLELCLPGEARWEYACRAGEPGAIYTGGLEILGDGNAPALDPIAWYGGNSGVDFELAAGDEIDHLSNRQFSQNPSGTHPVGRKQPNCWGLYDMLGNVWEWTADAWHDNYRGAPGDGSIWVEGEAGAGRVFRGGSWHGKARDCRSACRNRGHAGRRNVSLGFRPAQVQVSQAGQVGAPPAAPGVAAQAERAAHWEPRGGAVELSLPADRQAVVHSIPAARGLRLRTDLELLTLYRHTKPRWASAMGRDRFGLWSDIRYQTSEDPVRQRLRWIPPGRFQMGSPQDEQGRYDDENPVHQVVIRRGYWLFDAPVTQALWQAVMGDNPSEFKSPDRPVEQVSWDDCQAFLQKLNAEIQGLELCLPSEAQWEYACRAGSETSIYTGALKIIGENNAPALDSIAWYGGNSGEQFELDHGYDISSWPEKQYDSKKAGTHPVRQKAPNHWGLYDMLGNVWEWTADAWHDNYRGAPGDGSIWDEAEAGAKRVIRGGSWNDEARYCRSACRLRDSAAERDVFLGFRPAQVQS